MRYFCCDDQRRRAVVMNHPSINGIDFLEVSDDPLDSDAERQRTLLVHFLKPVSPDDIKLENVRIEGGERIRNIRVESVFNGNAALPPLGDDVLIVEVSERGDFSTYTLSLVAINDEDPISQKFDLILSSVEFSFKANCPTEFDCKPQRACPSESRVEPEINYLAKDYASFRQLMLDRMSLLMPGWTERSPADLGITLVELLAYVGDYLSYQQDAIATESYLNTARRRSSIKRHVRLIDYPMHDGRNARTWIHLEVTKAGDGLTLSRGKDNNTTKFLTGIGALADSVVINQDSSDFAKCLSEHPQVFEMMDEKVTLFQSRNQIKLYTWGSRECCLAKGSTTAALAGDFSDLNPGDVLLFVENRGPETGRVEDANLSHRHAVRLTSKPRLTPDRLGGQFKQTPDDDPVPVTIVEWSSDDALPFALSVSSKIGNSFFDDVGVALGNVLLVDHGHTQTDIPEHPTSLEPPVVPLALDALKRVSYSQTSRCDAATTSSVAPRYRPRVNKSPITQAAKYDSTSPPRSAALTRRLSFQDPNALPVPAIHLVESDNPNSDWNPSRDLLGTGAEDRVFVVEVETDGTAYLRFGDGQTGRRPPGGAKLLATYRIGNGTAGNVGADSIRHLVTSDTAFLGSDPVDPKRSAIITRISNPLPATGGVDAEAIEHVRQNAPAAFRRQERAVTPEDFEALTTRRDVVERCGLDIQHSAASLRWTGSWHTMFLTVDRLAGRSVDDEFETGLRSCLERYRMAGQDLEVDAPRDVPLEIEMAVCIKAGYFFEDVKQALLKVFSNRLETDGKRGIFHPDNFTFNQPVLSSRIIAAAQSVPGVASVVLTKFQRQGIDSTEALDSGRLEIGSHEIARLDNDPNFPERGVFILKRA